MEYNLLHAPVEGDGLLIMDEKELRCMKKMVLMLTALFAALLCAGESFTLSPSGEKNWQSPMYQIPAGRPPMQIHMKTLTTGPIDHHIRIHWFDRNGKALGSFFPRPPFHYPEDSLLNKVVPRVQTVLPRFYPAGAEKFRIVISTSDYRTRFPNLPPPGKTTFEEPEVRWLYRVTAEEPLNWFARTEPVAFTAILPPGVTGLRGIISDSDGKVLADRSVNGARWTWKAPSPGFYQVKFFHIGKDGAQTPVVETYSVTEHRQLNNTPVRLRRVGTFTRDIQNFVVTEKRERGEHEHPFGINMMNEMDYAPYFCSLQDSFGVARLCGLNAFVRWHWAPWNEIERERGRYDWRIVDRFLKIAEEEGYPQERVMLNTFGTPRWNSPKPQNTVWTSHYRSYAPLEMKPWGEYLKAFAMRYPGIRMWELWNEPHLPGGSIFWLESSPEQFVELMKTGYTALKSVNPENMVIHGGIGMRYIPFYDAVTRLGIQKYYDRLGTHVVTSHKPFFEVDRKYGALSKGFVETEWHVNLYNCSAQVLPTEEELCFRMLIRLAQMLNMNVEKIAAFNTFAGEKNPESARFFAAAGGIQQVTGLFRSVPFKEPRLSALALRTATDRFAGKVKALGARYFGDGNQQIALFESRAGRVAFFWSQEGHGTLNPLPEIAGMMKGKTVLDWEGRSVSVSQLKARRVYFVLDPDPAILKKGEKLEELSASPLLPLLDRSVAGNYAPLSSPVWIPVTRYVARNGEKRKSGFEARFAASFSSAGLQLEVEVNDAVHHPECDGKKVWEADSVQFALDAVGKGDNGDVLEFAVGKNNLIYKVRTPVLNGDLPAEYSEAGVPLRRSRAEIVRSKGKTLYRIQVAPGDLYPFIYRNNQPVRFALLINNNDSRGREGYLEWGSGIGGIKAPHRFGTLYRIADVREVRPGPWRVFQTGKLTAGDPVRLETVPESGKKAAGIFASIPTFSPGARYRISFRARGSSEILQAMVYGNSLQRQNFRSRRLSGKWQEFSLCVDVPENETALNLAIFFWKIRKGTFEVTSPRIVAE